MKLELYNQKGESSGKVEVADQLFQAPFHPDLVHQAWRVMRANQRRTIAYVKDRSEVRGGGKKPWSQKGTGRARHGSIRSPIWKGGGVTHGPSSARSFALRINRRMARQALLGVLSQKAEKKEIKIMEDYKPFQGKTKEAVRVLHNLLGVKKRRPSVLFILPQKEEKAKQSLRNIPRLSYTRINNLNILDLLNNRFLVFSKESLQELENILKSKQT
jgi:large subunit ribosomal protein L4